MENLRGVKKFRGSPCFGPILSFLNRSRRAIFGTNRQLDGVDRKPKNGPPIKKGPFWPKKRKMPLFVVQKKCSRKTNITKKSKKMVETLIFVQILPLEKQPNRHNWTKVPPRWVLYKMSKKIAHVHPKIAFPQYAPKNPFNHGFPKSSQNTPSLNRPFS